ncbi:Putative rRNA methylase [Aedoeadaptatus ivorii]|uniref:rRNA methylase n=1 Tax=Aedoeadaptatus ivorii TaxID=54006 RepID=A0A3S4ZQJ0_9FIRM|nr:class I SAM-dependent methyltransferase [Peptoniphilus ivorii]MDQ0507761.1 tRNA G37 N-methylase Trm5 [Peptoniphilus ivorii]VEJ35559.1 Putative rRNA methylase [Peptoniphilus ivorii]
MALVPSGAVAWSHFFLETFLRPEHIVADLTAGNGKDTVFCAARAKKVFAFDIQEQALEKTADRLEKAGILNAELILDSHAQIEAHLQIEDIDVFVMNLGYLPGGDKAITTMWKSTKRALSVVTKKMKPKAIISLCVYPGHEEGKREYEGTYAFLRGLSQQKFHISCVGFPNQANDPPQWILIERY